MIKLIIFDLDDTLVGKADDSVDLIAMRRKDVVNTLRLDSTSAEEKSHYLERRVWTTIHYTSACSLAMADW
jgi:FMN phosphatase YigB (HAD superfamily)